MVLTRSTAKLLTAAGFLDDSSLFLVEPVADDLLPVKQEGGREDDERLIVERVERQDSE